MPLSSPAQGSRWYGKPYSKWAKIEKEDKHFAAGLVRYCYEGELKIKTLPVADFYDQFVPEAEAEGKTREELQWAGFLPGGTN